jgi:hypothetical protein
MMVKVIVSGLQVIAFASRFDAQWPAPLSDLLEFPWAMPDQAVSAMDRLKGIYLAESLLPPEPQIRSTSLIFILRLLGSSNALSFVVRSSLADAEQNDIIALDVDHKLPVRYAGIVKRRAA